MKKDSEKTVPHLAKRMARDAERRLMPLSSQSQAQKGEVVSVTFGATRGQGGTRSHTITVGGEKTMPFYSSEGKNPHPPAVAIDVFDMKISLAKPVKDAFREVLEDPSEWARLAVEKYRADMVTIHLISTDPALKDRSAREAAGTVEDVLQAVKVPVIVGGSGNPEKDPIVLEKAAEVASGERVMLNSANLNMDWKRIAKAAVDYDQILLSFTSMDINDQKMLNRFLFNEGVKKERMLMDPTTAALGYGLEYSFSLIERLRLSALKGDTDFCLPIASGTTNAWGAREAWMDVPEWGDRDVRGPLWEAVSALSLCIAGADVFMMMNPFAVELFRETVAFLRSEYEPSMNALNWVEGD
jgi:acetyl-CoA decarbonylase/synthase complex subunit delta